MDTVKIIGCILIGLIVIGLIVWRVYGKSKNKQAAIEFLEGFANTLYKNMVKLVTSLDEDIFKDGEFDEVYDDILVMINDSCWEYIKEYSDTAAQEDKIESAILSVLTRDFVEKFVSTVIDKFGIEKLIEERWKNLQIEDGFAERVEKEDKELQEKFSDPENYIEEIDEKNDLELAKEGTVYTTNEDGSINEIERPADVEDPDLDTENDESVEVLTPEEIEQGIHFNKAGRKVNKFGRFVK